MNIYEVCYRRYNEHSKKTVAAKNAEKALENFARFAKKNYFSTDEIISITRVMKVDVYYKS